MAATHPGQCEGGGLTLRASSSAESGTHVLDIYGISREVSRYCSLWLTVPEA
jgi:hypothetical protein